MEVSITYHDNINFNFDDVYLRTEDEFMGGHKSFLIRTVRSLINPFIFNSTIIDLEELYIIEDEYDSLSGNLNEAINYIVINYIDE